MKSKFGMIAYLLLFFVPVFTVISVFFIFTRNNLINSKIYYFEILSDLKKGEMLNYVETLSTRTADFASDGYIKDSVEKIEKTGTGADDLSFHLRENKKPLSENLFAVDIVDSQGKILVSTDNKRTGQDVSSENYFRNGLSYLTAKDIRLNSDGNMEIVISTPIKTREKPFDTVGVLVNHYDINAVLEMLQMRAIVDNESEYKKYGLGATGEVYLARQSGDKNILVVSNLQDGAKSDTFPFDKCLNEGEGVSGSWIEPSGVRVVGSSRCVKIDNFVWTFIVKQRVEDIFAAENFFTKYILAIFAVTCLAITTFGLKSFRRFCEL